MNRHAKLILLILAVAVAVSVLALPAQAAIVTKDYTRPGATSYSVLTSGDILERALGLQLGEAEKNYLSLHGDFTIRYASHIPSSYVSVDYRSDTQILVVEAEKYSHETKEGVIVEWTPVSVIVGNEEKQFESVDNGKYKSVFESVEEENDAVARVKYSTQFNVSKGALNKIINQAYEDADEWQRRIAEETSKYERLLAEYEQNSANYEEYLDELEEYRAKFALYEAYLVDKRKYDDALEEYNNYLDELAEFERLSLLYAEYEEKLAQYAVDYAAYEKYLKDKEEYPDKLAAYNIYVEKCEKIRAQLALMDGMKRYVTSYNRSLYAAIMGNTVTDVLKNSDTLTIPAVGVDKATIQMADDATRNIRELYNGYFALTEEKDKYAYYFLYYENIRDNFIALFQSLDKMYENEKVRLGIDQYGPDMQEKFEILLAQLYYTVLALSDQPVLKYDGKAYFTSSYVVNVLTEKKPITVLEGEPYMIDTNSAEPLLEGYPSAVKEPEAVVEVDEPNPVEYMAEPTEPAEVTNPGEPPEEKTEPCEPQPVGHPGVAPIPYEPPQTVSKLVDAYARGELESRDNTGSAANITVSLTVEKSFFNQEICTVKFRDTDGTLLEAIEVDKNSFAEYTGPIPQKEEDACATSYTFAGWVDKNGVEVDLTSVQESMEVYPLFIPDYKSYIVSWDVDGVITTEELVYGTLPEYDGVPYRPDGSNAEYEFEGWDKPVVPLVCNTTYKAQFATYYIVELPDGSGAHINRNEKGDFTVDIGETDSGEVSLSKIIERASSKGALTVKHEEFTVRVAFADVIAMQATGADRISLFFEEIGESSYAMKLNLLTADGTAVNEPIRAYVTLPCSFSDLTKLKVYSLNEAGKRVKASYTLTDDEITILHTAGTEYYAVTEYEYAVILIPSDTVAVSLERTKALVGETVTVMVDAPVGVTVDGIYTVDSAGRKVYLTENSFVMPHGDVSVGVDFHLNKYTVSFVSDGKIISTEQYLYGETPAPPASPVKLSDKTYTYTFAGWSSEIVPVTEDITYEAVYTSELILPKEKQDGFYATPGVWKIIVAIGVASLYVLLVFLPCLTIVIVKVVFCKRRKVNANRQKT